MREVKEARLNNKQKQMKQKIIEAIERNFETDNEEIARLIKDGCTSGILDNEEGYRIVWDLNVEKFEH